jgi:hypothetical protein
MKICTPRALEVSAYLLRARNEEDEEFFYDAIKNGFGGLATKTGTI